MTQTIGERLVSNVTRGTETDDLADELRQWVAASRRFREFVHQHRDKIRKKLRGARDPESRRDVRAELRVANLLLADRRMRVAPETYGSGRAGPDFTVDLQGERPFNLEVTRHRRPATAAIHGPVLTKLRQLPPGAPNALLIATDGAGADTIDVGAAIRRLRVRADAKDEPFFTARGFTGTRAFYDRFLRLGAVFVWSDAAAGDAAASVWINRSARIAVPEPAIRACLACLRRS